MKTKDLSQFVVRYIEGRRDARLGTFDKQADLQLSGENGQAKTELFQQLSKKRQELEATFDVRTWLSNAASRAWQVSLVTHAVKYFHGDAKGSSVYMSGQSPSSPFLCSATLNSPVVDAVGNSASLDVAKLLQTEHEGDSLLASFKRGDYSALEDLAVHNEQVNEWVNGFEQAFSDKKLSSHCLAKQLYFPVSWEGDYHLISPLYPTSLAHALYQRITHSRFSVESIEARKARRKGLWDATPVQFYPDIAVQNIGGSNQQNVSYLNCKRNGKNHLIRCAPPKWQQTVKPPSAQINCFASLTSKTSYVVTDLVRYLQRVTGQESTMEIRQNRAEYVDELIGLVLNYGAEIQSLSEQQGWSQQEECVLKTAQQLWLDPLRQKVDQEFRQLRERGEWINEVAEDFTYWLNSRLNKYEKLTTGAVESREWTVLMRRRLREFEAAQKDKWQ